MLLINCEMFLTLTCSANCVTSKLYLFNIYLVYKINKIFPKGSYLTLKNCLFGALSLTKNADIGKYK